MATEADRPLGRVLYVCTGNTFRSVLAEYISRQDFAGRVAFESAGIRPQTAADSSNAVFALRRNFNIDASTHVPRSVESLDLAVFDLVIALDNAVVPVVEKMGVPTGKIKVWRIRDPWGGDLTEYDDACLDIKKRVAQLKAHSGAGTRPRAQTDDCA